MGGNGRNTDDFEVWLPGVGAIEMNEETGFVPGLPTVDTFSDDTREADSESAAATAEAHEIIARAKDEAEEVIQAAHEEAAEIRRSAEEQVQQEIQEAVEAEVRAVRDAQTKAFQGQARQLVREFQQAAEDSLAHLTQQVARLVSAIVEKVVYRKIADDDEIVLQVIEEAFSELPDATTLTVTVHPDDAGVVNEHRDALIRAAGSIESIRILKDEDIQPGGCLLDSDAGEVDARVQSRLAAIWEAISTHTDGERAA